MRDQKIPVIAFVANTGGLLGLCMGFSLVSVFEILYHAFVALRKIVTGTNRQADDDGLITQTYHMSDVNVPTPFSISCCLG